MRIVILEDAGQAPDALQSIIPEVFDDSVSNTGILAALSLPGIVLSGLTRSDADSDSVESQSQSPNPLAPFHMEDCPELTPTALNTFGLASLASGRLTEAEHFITTALDLRLNFFGDGHPEVALSRNSLARVYRDAGKLEAAVEEVTKAKDINVRAYGEHSLPVAADLSVLSSIELQQAKLQTAKDTALSAKQIFDDILSGNDPWVPYLLDIIARVHQSLGQYSQAEALYEELLPLDIKHYGADHPVVATHHHNKGTVLEAKGDLKGAETVYSKAIDIFQQHGCNIHPQMIDALANRGAVRRARKDLAGARLDMEQALQLNEKLRGDAHAFTGYDYFNLGCLELDSSNPAEALGYFDRALPIFRQALPENHGYIAATLTMQGRALLGQNPAKAEQPLEEALRIWPVEYGRQSVEYAIANATLAKAWFEQGRRLSEVEQIMRASIAVIAAIKPETDNALQLIRGWLAEVTRTESAAC